MFERVSTVATVSVSDSALIYVAHPPHEHFKLGKGGMFVPLIFKFNEDMMNTTKLPRQECDNARSKPTLLSINFFSYFQSYLLIFV